MTTIVIHDPELLAKLAATEGQIIFQGPTGDPVKKVETAAAGKLPPGFKIPFTDEELARRSQDRTGRPLAEVWRTIYEKYVGDDVEPFIVKRTK